MPRHGHMWHGKGSGAGDVKPATSHEYGSVSTMDNDRPDDKILEVQAEDVDQSSSVVTIGPLLDEVDPGIWTHWACVVGLALMWATGVGVIVYGAVVQSITDKSSDGYEPSIRRHKALAPFLRLAVSFAITALSDIAGLIHSTSLRFALLAERRLSFNSNIRLFTSCAKSRVHSWPVNLLWAWSLVSSYACGSMVILETIYSFSDTLGSPSYTLDVVSGYSLIFLGFGLLGQASIATWTLMVNKIPTWSTDPVFVASVCQSHRWLVRLSRRTMLSVHDAQDLKAQETPTLPRSRQGSLLRANFRIRRVLIVVWVVALVGFLWFAAISIAYQLKGDRGTSWGTFSRSYTNDWSIIPNWVDTTAFLPIPTSLGHTYFSFGPWFLCKYLLTCAFTAGITLDLHIVEIIVQCLRDESLWRQTASVHGLRPQSHGAIYTAFTSWLTILLFVFKSLIHWMFSLAFGLMWEGIELRIPQALYTAVLLLALALLATTLALYRPKGPQPATFGHLPTLIDCIDVWPCQKSSDSAGDRVERGDKSAKARPVDQDALYWGDKGEDVDGIHRAGTAFAPLKPIAMSSLYF